MKHLMEYLPLILVISGGIIVVLILEAILSIRSNVEKIRKHIEGKTEVK